MFRWTADIMDMIFCCAKNLIHVMEKVGRKAGLICIGEYYIVGAGNRGRYTE